MPKLTKDEHLHDKSPEYVYRLHHGLDPLTGEPARGVAEPGDDCACAHCHAHRQGDDSILSAAKEAWDKAKAKKGPVQKTYSQAEVDALLQQQKAQRGSAAVEQAKEA